MTPDQLLEFLRGQRWAVEASVAKENQPQAAVIGVAVTEKCELVFDTLAASRKAENLRANPRIALVVGWDDGQTAQIEGVADEPTGGELRRLKEIYFNRFPDGRSRAAVEEMTYIRVSPSWIRYSDFRSTPPAVTVFSADDIRRACGERVAK